MRQFAHLKDDLISADIYISCLIDGVFKQFQVDSEELDKDVDQLECDLAIELGLSPDKVRVFNLAIIETLRDNEELREYWRRKNEHN